VDEIFRPSRQALGSTQPPVKWIQGLSQGWRWPGLGADPHPHLECRGPRKSRAIPLLTLRACVAYKMGENRPTLTETPTEMSTRSISCAVVTKSGNLNFLEASGPLRACNGTAANSIMHFVTPIRTGIFHDQCRDKHLSRKPLVSRYIYCNCFMIHAVL